MDALEVYCNMTGGGYTCLTPTDDTQQVRRTSFVRHGIQIVLLVYPRRPYVASTSGRCHYNIICLLG